MNVKLDTKNISLNQISALSSHHPENYSTFFIFPYQNMMCSTRNKRFPWLHLRTMSIINVCKTCLKGVKLKWKNVISLSCGVLELLRKNLKGQIKPPSIDRDKKTLKHRPPFWSRGLPSPSLSFHTKFSKINDVWVDAPITSIKLGIPVYL